MSKRMSVRHVLTQTHNTSGVLALLKGTTAKLPKPGMKVILSFPRSRLTRPADMAEITRVSEDCFNVVYSDIILR